MGGRRPLRRAGRGRRPGPQTGSDAAQGQPPARRGPPQWWPRRANSGTALRSPGPNGLSMGSAPGCPASPHLERGGTGSSGRRNRPQRNRGRPEVGNGNALETARLFPALTFGAGNPREPLPGISSPGEGARPFRDLTTVQIARAPAGCRTAPVLRMRLVRGAELGGCFRCMTTLVLFRRKSEAVPFPVLCLERAGFGEHFLSEPTDISRLPASVAPSLRNMKPKEHPGNSLPHLLRGSFCARHCRAITDLVPDAMELTV
ncbi:uncharacterized protein LOC122892483 [Neovison vison]|uniref:uncharacterized protein LOC122892483 n=1 Tax=Neovison vison TaxID=452646 RepID=UPI001CF074B0|nr:uncharacterized protein LOC122892483 [Neogale vison]